MLWRYFGSHPASVGENYVTHLWHACGFGLRLILAGIACLVHAILPFLFVRTGSEAVRALNDRMVVNRIRTGGDDGRSLGRAGE